MSSDAVTASLRWILIGCVTVAMALAVQLVSPSGAAAAAGDPIRERGVVARVLDGDTIDVRVDGGSEIRVRLSGIQAFETGECGADIATARLRQLVDGKRIELRAKNADSRSFGRPVRSVHLPLASGGTADINRLMLLEGMGLWFPMEPEITATASYHVAATHARRAGRGIWQSELCGRGPQHGHPLQMWVKSDADGNDAGNLNDEYVVIVNRSSSQAIGLGGWLLRESSQFRQNPDEEGFRFPAGASIPAGRRIVVRVGSGRDTAGEFFMGSTTPLFDNADRTTGTTAAPVIDRGMGDGAYLLDPRGNVRVAFTYPCVVECATSLLGKLKIDHVEYDPPGVDTAANEYVRLRNTASTRIELDGYQLRNIYVAHEFVPGTYLDAGETLTVRVGSGTSTRREQFWGQPAAMLSNAGDRVDVLSFDERYVDCRAWGSGRSCPWPVGVPGAGSSGALPTAPELRAPLPRVFSDVDPGSTHGPAIAWLVEEAITGGCGDGRFCPSASVTRAQMATFLTTALELPPAPSQGFTDVRAGSTHARSIDALAQAGITGGCGEGRFCPSASVTRAQMATFLTIALELPPAPWRTFSDVPVGSRHAANIGALADAGVTSGCGAGRFCPTDAVSRAQMATFLRSALT